jgi:ligand-binding sensor domain-containing protein
MKNSFFTPIKMALLFLLFLTLPSNIFSQLTDWVNYTRGDVLAKMYNDGDYLWVATDGGLVKLNKTTEEKVFYTRANTNGGLPENILRSLTKDKNGNLWVSTQYHGIGKFDGVSGISYFPEKQSCYSITVDDENNIWFSGGCYINKFDGTNLQSWTTPWGRIYE